MRIVGLHSDCQDCEKGEPRLRWDCELLKWSFGAGRGQALLLEVPFFCEAPQVRFGALPCSWDHATIGEQTCRDVSLVPLYSSSIFHGTFVLRLYWDFRGD